MSVVFSGAPWVSGAIVKQYADFNERSLTHVLLLDQVRDTVSVNIFSVKIPREPDFLHVLIYLVKESTCKMKTSHTPNSYVSS